jgi:uncharacterized membrane protein (DUF106 family)
MDKEGSFKGPMIVLGISMLIAAFWNQLDSVRSLVSAALDPTAGVLLNWNLTQGMVILIFILTVITTIAQKYGTDQEALRGMKKDQKVLQEEMKKYKDHPEKFMELQKESMKFMMPMMKLGMRPIVYTGIPIILFFRWFMDFFTVLGDPKFFGIFNWFWFYLLGSIIFSSVLRKIWKVA